jgi:hypothetical protein
MNLKDELANRSHQNWMELPPLVRQGCLQELKSAIPTEVLSKWLLEYLARGTIEQDDPFFHFDTGMAVRNVLRERLPESELSQITGMERSDWDNFYIGALRELLDNASLSLMQVETVD